MTKNNVPLAGERRAPGPVQRWKESYLRAPRLWWTRLIFLLTPLSGLFMVMVAMPFSAE